MNSQTLAAALTALLDDDDTLDALHSEDGVDSHLASVRTYEDAGVLTSNDGLVLRFTDGTEFQLTLVQSR